MRRHFTVFSSVSVFVLVALGIALMRDDGLLSRGLSAPAPINTAQVISTTESGMTDFELVSSIDSPDAPDLNADAGREYMVELGLTPQDARYFDLIHGKLPLSSAETMLLARNGFLASETYQWPRFSDAYAWIYWQDLPILVTTDSLLHAVHQSYSDLLKDLELNVLMPQLQTLLQATKTQVEDTAARSTGPALAPLYDDVESYLAVALALLEGSDGESALEREWLDLANRAGSMSTIELFGTSYQVDFTLFQPRGHYASSEELQRYFRAMSWLGLVDFRILAFDATGQPKANPEALAAAAVLRDALEDAGQRTTWQTLNALIEMLVGPSDNMTLSDFDRLWDDLQLENLADALALDESLLTSQLTTHDYGQQRITGQILYRHTDHAGSAPVQRPVSLALLGQRFALDVFILGNLVYDRLLVDGQPVERALPNPLDVMYALGNDHAVTHLTDELATYSYGRQLAALRGMVDSLEPTFWTAPIYNQWLDLIRALNAPTLDERYPLAMRTESWADKVLQTQLASWAQLRHDNILYVKQSRTTGGITCEYPAGYVEPYPEFYAALGGFADAGLRALADIDLQELPRGQYAREHAMDYFSDVGQIAGQLQVLAEKELRREPFTADEEAFLKSIVRYQTETVSGLCGAPPLRELWDGWYMDLFYYEDDNPAVIADVHTSANNDPRSALYPPRVLHVATGQVAPLFFLVDTGEGTTLYVGPAFTYYEVTESGYPPTRLTDQEWRRRLAEDKSLRGPVWTSSFRLPASASQETLTLPGRDALVNEFSGLPLQVPEIDEDGIGVGDRLSPESFPVNP